MSFNESICEQFKYLRFRDSAHEFVFFDKQVEKKGKLVVRNIIYYLLNYFSTIDDLSILFYFGLIWKDNKLN